MLPLQLAAAGFAGPVVYGLGRALFGRGKRKEKRDAEHKDGRRGSSAVPGLDRRQLSGATPSLSRGESQVADAEDEFPQAIDWHSRVDYLESDMREEPPGVPATLPGCTQPRSIYMLHSGASETHIVADKDLVRTEEPPPRDGAGTDGDSDAEDDATSKAVVPAPPRAQPITTLEDLLAWRPGPEDEARRATTPLPRDRASVARMRGGDGPRLLVCHDMKGGYLDQDAPTQGSRDSRFYKVANWGLVDAFVYFSHALVTVPPPHWTNAAHRNGARVLGTFITEWDEGAAICNKVFESKASAEMVASQLTALAEHMGFEGWLINLENDIPPTLLRNVVHFLSRLRARMRAVTPHSQVLWYDAVTADGRLDWQNTVNGRNAGFWEAADGIFVNYSWAPGDLPALSDRLGTPARRSSVYMGVDVFGRNTHYHGGLETGRAVAAAMSMGLSCAIFAPGWSYESCEGEAAAAGARGWQERDARMWRGIRKALLAVLGPGSHRPVSTRLPFHSSFCSGSGRGLWCMGAKVSGRPWWNLSLQSVQPVCGASTAAMQRRGMRDRAVTHALQARISHSVAYQGSSALQITGRLPPTARAELPLFPTAIPLRGVEGSRRAPWDTGSSSPTPRQLLSPGGDKQELSGLVASYTALLTETRDVWLLLWVSVGGEESEYGDAAAAEDARRRPGQSHAPWLPRGLKLVVLRGHSDADADALAPQGGRRTGGTLDGLERLSEADEGLWHDGGSIAAHSLGLSNGDSATPPAYESPYESDVCPSDWTDISSPTEIGSRLSRGDVDSGVSESEAPATEREPTFAIRQNSFHHHHHHHHHRHTHHGEHQRGALASPPANSATEHAHSQLGGVSGLRKQRSFSLPNDTLYWHSLPDAQCVARDGSRAAFSPSGTSELGAPRAVARTLGEDLRRMQSSTLGRVVTSYSAGQDAKRKAEENLPLAAWVTRAYRISPAALRAALELPPGKSLAQCTIRGIGVACVTLPQPGEPRDPFAVDITAQDHSAFAAYLGSVSIFEAGRLLPASVMGAGTMPGPLAGAVRGEQMVPVPRVDCQDTTVVLREKKPSKKKQRQAEREALLASEEQSAPAARPAVKHEVDSLFLNTLRPDVRASASGAGWDSDTGVGRGSPHRRAPPHASVSGRRESASGAAGGGTTRRSVTGRDATPLRESQAGGAGDATARRDTSTAGMMITPTGLAFPQAALLPPRPRTSVKTAEVEQGPSSHELPELSGRSAVDRPPALHTRTRALARHARQQSRDSFTGDGGESVAPAPAPHRLGVSSTAQAPQAAPRKLEPHLSTVLRWSLPQDGWHVAADVPGTVLESFRQMSNPSTSRPLGSPYGNSEPRAGDEDASRIDFTRVVRCYVYAFQGAAVTREDKRMALAAHALSFCVRGGQPGSRVLRYGSQRRLGATPVHGPMSLSAPRRSPSSLRKQKKKPAGYAEAYSMRPESSRHSTPGNDASSRNPGRRWFDKEASRLGGEPAQSPQAGQRATSPGAYAENAPQPPPLVPEPPAAPELAPWEADTAPPEAPPVQVPSSSAQPLGNVVDIVTQASVVSQITRASMEEIAAESASEGRVSVDLRLSPGDDDHVQVQMLEEGHPPGGAEAPAHANESQAPPQELVLSPERSRSDSGQDRPGPRKGVRRSVMSAAGVHPLSADAKHAPLAIPPKGPNGEKVTFLGVSHSDRFVVEGLKLLPGSRSVVFVVQPELESGHIIDLEACPRLLVDVSTVAPPASPKKKAAVPTQARGGRRSVDLARKAGAAAPERLSMSERPDFVLKV
ncbi:unnamed protein product [Pedinophyceae sp. YPF-701]|nr:unnamed protein product [Pedinophyceae sp. YPF-701]